MLFKTRKVKCPDGRRLRVYRNAEDAFPMLASAVKGQLNATVEAAGELRAGAQGEVIKEVHELASRIDLISSSLRERLRAVYVVYQADPCSNGSYLADEVRRINQQEERLREVAIALDHIVRVRAAGTPDDAVLRLIADIVDRLPRAPTDDIDRRLDENTERWRKELPE